MAESLKDKKIPAWGNANTKGKDKTPIEAVKFPFPNSRDLANDQEAIKKARGGELGSNARVPATFVPGYKPGRGNVYSDKVKK